jgi:hypothetical protein
MVDLKYYLHDLGFTFKNGISLLDEKYRQYQFAKLIIENGIVYRFSENINPTSLCFYDHKSPIDYNNEKLDIINKPFLLSGVAKHILKKNMNH